MIKNLTSLLLLSSLLCVVSVKSQEEEVDTSNIESKFPSIGIGTGVLTYNGEIGKIMDVSNYSHIRIGAHLNVEKRFNASFGAALNGMFGKVASSERSVIPEGNVNFETTIMQVGLAGVYHLDNNYILKRSSVIGPYASLGIAFLKFNPKGDLMKGDTKYYYWTDGSIRDLPETSSNFFTSNIIKRDYTYETPLVDPTKNYPKATLSIPITIGSRFQLNDNYEASVGATYHLAFSDYLDNIKGGAGNDGYLYFSCSITYNFPLKVVDAPIYQNIDFQNIEKIDADKDGVTDDVDMCLNTPVGVEISKDGCPLDDDKDGVPNYLDKEADTPKGATVDANGAKITDEALAKKTEQYDTQAIGRTNLGFEFGTYDKDNDGYISPEEMRSAMDDFFSGKSDYSIEKFQQLVQFFVRQ